MKSKIITFTIFIILLLGIGFLLLNLNKESSSQLTTKTPLPTSVISYTLADIAKHSTKTDCWMAIEGKVYNVTSFIPNHPGGKAILNGCGKDATTLFDQRPTKNLGPHPEEAREILAKFYIGDFK